MRLLQDTRLELWCEALESGKYEKCSGRLAKHIQFDVDIKRWCFCALGVAVEVYWEHNPDELEFDVKYMQDGSWPCRAYYWFCGETRYEATGWLPPKVARWYGVREQGQLIRPLTFGGKAHVTCLDTLNDRRWSFKAMAGLIRRGYLERVAC